MSTAHFENKKGVTVAELKRLIADWPEVDAFGEPSEVWISNGRALSSIVTLVCQLNSADLILTN